MVLGRRRRVVPNTLQRVALFQHGTHRIEDVVCHCTILAKQDAVAWRRERTKGDEKNQLKKSTAAETLSALELGSVLVVYS